MFDPNQILIDLCIFLFIFYKTVSDHSFIHSLHSSIQITFKVILELEQNHSMPHHDCLFYYDILAQVGT